MTRCNCIGKRLREFIDGELAPKDRQQVLLHLQTCAACEHQYRRLLAAVEATRLLPHEDAPPHFTASLQVRLASLRAARQPIPWWRRAARQAAVWSRPRGRRVTALVGASLAAGLLAASFLTTRQPGVAEIARRAEFSWSRVANYSCEMVTRGIYHGEPREFRQRTWYMKPGLYRFETNQDYPLVTVVDDFAVRHFIKGGDWQGRGPFVIVRPRTRSREDVPFPFGITWPAATNLTVDTLIRQLQGSTGASMEGTEAVRGKECYQVQFETPGAAGRRPERCTMWLAEDSALPLRIHRRRDVENDVVTEAVNLRFNVELLPSDTFELKATPGAFIIHGDVDPHVFALKPRRNPWFDRDPLFATRREVALRSDDLPFAALVPGYLPSGYRLVTVRRARGRWLDAHWIDDRPAGAARVIRLVEQAEAVEDPPEVRDGASVILGAAGETAVARVTEGKEPYPHCFVSWRERGTLLTLSTAEISLEETLRIARSFRAAPAEVPPLPTEFVGPPAPPRTRPAPGPSAGEAPSAPVAPDGASLPTCSEPPMMPETAQEEYARRGPTTAR